MESVQFGVLALLVELVNAAHVASVRVVDRGIHNVAGFNLNLVVGPIAVRCGGTVCGTSGATLLRRRERVLRLRLRFGRRGHDLNLVVGRVILLNLICCIFIVTALIASIGIIFCVSLGIWLLFLVAFAVAVYLHLSRWFIGHCHILTIFHAISITSTAVRICTGVLCSRSFPRSSLIITVVVVSDGIFGGSGNARRRRRRRLAWRAVGHLLVAG